MYKIDIVIPSLNRIDKLTNTINSVFLSAKDIPINLYLYFSVQSELDHFKEQFKDISEVQCIMFPDYSAPRLWNFHIKGMSADLLVYLNDDTLLYDSTLELVIKKFKNEIPDLDGILGLAQANLPEDQACPGAFGVIGKKFMERFPDKRVFNEDYERFYIDKELFLFANEIRRFHFDRDIKIEHLHPLFGGTKDSTHDNVRKHLPVDKKTWQIRQANNFLWGRDFNLVNKTVRM